MTYVEIYNEITKDLLAPRDSEGFGLLRNHNLKFVSEHTDDQNRVTEIWAGDRQWTDKNGLRIERDEYGMTRIKDVEMREVNRKPQRKRNNTKG